VETSIVKSDPTLLGRIFTATKKAIKFKANNRLKYHTGPRAKLHFQLHLHKCNVTGATPRRISLRAGEVVEATTF
jgi:hypothetical protein